jgi:hypothetical protein
MADLDPKGKGDKSMPGNHRSRPDVRGGAVGDPRDMAKAGLLEAQSPDDESSHPPETMSETGALLCDSIDLSLSQPSEQGAMPSEGIQGDEWDAYLTLSRTAGMNVGSPTGRESYGDGGLVVVVGVTPDQGGRESRPQGKGGQVTGHSKAVRYA